MSYFQHILTYYSGAVAAEADPGTGGPVRAQAGSRLSGFKGFRGTGFSLVSQRDPQKGICRFSRPSIMCFLSRATCEGPCLPPGKWEGGSG